MERKLLRDSENEARKRLVERIKAITDILDNAYGEERTATAYGGYVLFFPNEEIYRENVSNILDYYHLSPEVSEYMENIYSNDNIEWCEELFLISSEDSITFIYPRRK